MQDHPALALTLLACLWRSAAVSINPTMMDYVKLGMSHYKYTYTNMYLHKLQDCACMYVYYRYIHPCHTVVYRQSESYSLYLREKDE